MAKEFIQYVALILLTLSGGVDARIKYTINDRWLFAKADIEHASLDSAEGIEWEG